MSWLPWIATLLGTGTVFLLVPALIVYCRRSSLPHRAGDLHHTHKAAVPRLGGIALAAAFGLVQVFITFFLPDQSNSHDRMVLLGSSLAMFGLGLWDDIKPLGARKKLVGQLLVASSVCAFGIGITAFKLPWSGQIIELGSWGAVLTVIWLVSMTNLINLIDGVDGLASGICLMLMALLAYVCNQNSGFELTAAGMAGALLGFLWFNFPPARIYLGDGGAYFLGFQIGFLSLVASHKGTVVAALVAPLFVLALPIVDTLLAILRRGLRGLPIFRPDRKHIHHRLLEMGFSRRKAVLSIYGITVVFLAMGFLVFVSRGELTPTLLGITVLILLLCAGKLNFSREWFAVGRVLGNSLEMRQEIQYALSLTHWLRLEGARQNSIEALWPDLVFIVQRLGFTSISLRLADGARTWQSPEPVGHTQHWRHSLRSGQAGVLELKAPATPESETKSSNLISILDPKLFDILCELVAEGWLKATRNWMEDKTIPLSFSSASTRSKPLVSSPALAQVADDLLTPSPRADSQASIKAEVS
jgi:UDP-GlcNAc:undecaprenyl-phosphate/decaprenyl-phosphate GlcNAc-1-phosphate transferase